MTSSDEDSTMLKTRISLEDDDSANAEHSVCTTASHPADSPKPFRSVIRTLKYSDPTPRVAAPALHHELTSSAGYLDVSITTAQSLPTLPGHTLLVLHITTHPGMGYHFSHLSLTWTFHNNVEIVAHAPRRSFGATTSETRRRVWGFELPLTATVGVVGLGVTPNVSEERERVGSHSMTIVGTARGSPVRRMVVWTVEENGSAETGLPGEVQFAVVVVKEEEEAGIRCAVDVRAKVEGGFMGRYLKGRGWEAQIDPGLGKKKDGNGKGILKEFDVMEEGQVEQLLKGWTGEVKGSILEFGGVVVTP